MGVSAYKDRQGRTRYRVTLSRHGRRLVDERLPAGTSKDKAETYYAKLVGGWFDRERLGISEIPLIAAVMQEYERRIIPDLKSPQFAGDCMRTAAPHVIGHTLDQLPACAKAMQEAMRASNTTVVHRLRFLKTLARYAIKWGMADRDYGVTISVPALHNERHFYPKKAEVAHILRFMSQEMRWACWQLYYSGLRRAELWTAKIQGGCYVNATSKNGKPRITPIILPLRKIVGTPTMTKDALSKRFKAAAVQAGLGHYRLHDLRHGQASLLINAGAPLNVVAEALGHDDLKSTRRYAHLQTEAKAAWMNFAATGRQVTEKYGLPAGRRPATYKKKAA